MRLLVACRMAAVLTLLTGILYPLAMTGLVHILFPAQAEGGLIMRDGRVMGSSLIGQRFNSARYFRGRPSAAGDKGYDASSSGGSNLGPTNKALIESVRTRLKDVIEENPGIGSSQVPIDLVTASASGLDPEISPAAAELQVARVAAARKLSAEIVRRLVRQHTRARLLGIFGEPGVNVLMLNLALDDMRNGVGRLP
jgi:potassium-transporting ATPase KdpC subunit